MLLARSVDSVFSCDELVCTSGPRLGCELRTLVGDLLFQAQVELGEEQVMTIVVVFVDLVWT